VVERYRDPRLRLLVNDKNLGVGASTNRGLATIGSEYVARLDGDGLSFPHRLAQQVAYLDDHPDVAAIGSQAVLIDVDGRRIGEFRRPTTELGIRWWRIFGSPVIQTSGSVWRKSTPSVISRRRSSRTRQSSFDAPYPAAPRAAGVSRAKRAEGLREPA
jgi:glycosyltransferase involved in cell wall biosynthesis